MAQNDDIKALQQQVAALQDKIAELTGQPRPRPVLKPEEKPDYVAFGSEEHAKLLGLKKGKNGEWELEDITSFGPNATEKFLAATLQQKLNELGSKPTVPTNAPEMWMPADAQIREVVI